MKKYKVVFVIVLAAVAAWLGNGSEAQSGKTAKGQSQSQYEGWMRYGGGPDNIHYSTLKEIKRENVHRLAVAWSYDTGDALDGSEMQCNPVIVDGVLYATSPKLRVFALDAATGKERWSFDPNEGRKPQRMRNRGVTFWKDGAGGRIFFGYRQWLYALDARTGQPVKEFGEAGRVDLRVGLGRDPQTLTVGLTTPGVIYQDLLIVGSLVGEGLPSAPGHIRAYDTRTGLLCLEAKTGKRKWHFQTVRHDVWDRDLPAAPALVTLKRNGHSIDAVAQTTKSGHVFVFERETGKPVFPIGYRKVPTVGIDGEKLAATQPFPLLPPPVARQTLTEEMLTTRTPAAHAAVLELFRKLRSNGQFEPPSKEGTIVFPGFDGGPVWGGAAFDPATGLFYVNSSEVPCILRLAERPKQRATQSGKSLYERDCASCHGKDLSGNTPDFPALVSVNKKYNEAEVHAVIRQGLGRMPGYAALGNEAIQAITRYLTKGEDIALAAYEQAAPSPIDLKYTIEDGYRRFLDPDGYPAVEPPWGTLNAIDLNEGKIVWQIPLGEHPELVAKGLRDTGSWNYGGPIVTASGLVFIGATNYDKKFRAFDKATGKLLWESGLPFAGNATPATYEVNGRQFLVIAAGGGKRGAPSGGTYVAFALAEGSVRETRP